MTKTLIFDSSSIISLALNSLLYILRPLKKNFDVRFVIPEQVKRECIDRPINNKKYELEAMMINQLLEEGVLELPEKSLNREISSEIEIILQKANSSFKANGEWMKIIGLGEAGCIALSNVLDRKGVENVLVIDERTARMICEKPENLRKLFSNKFHKEIFMEKSNFNIFQNKKIIRSSELCFVAYKKKLVGISDGIRLLDALLYAAKFKGCAISNREIQAIKAMA